MSDKNNIKLKTVNESITINRYDNGWMIEIGGKDFNDDWKTQKFIVNTEEELLAYVKTYNSMKLSD